MATTISMKSTWRTWDRSRWNVWHWAIHLTDVYPSHPTIEPPVFQKNVPMPYTPALELHKSNLFHAFWPLTVHQVLTWSGFNLSPVAATLFYELAFLLNGINMIRTARAIGQEHGFLDGDKHKRDAVPDAQEGNIIISLVMTAALRPLMGVLFIYDRTKAPLSISPWAVLEIGIYQITLDFFYYWFHRSLHETNLLWPIHKKHHTTKHPNCLLTLYADSTQEMFDVLLVPLATFLTMRHVMRLPMGYYDWWVCQVYTVMTELWGHSGLRIFMTPPSPFSPILKRLGGELTIEDHDLHHRQGWKKSHNYGKQTCLWDRIFGTRAARIEAVPDNIDWNKPVRIPLFVWGRCPPV